MTSLAPARPDSPLRVHLRVVSALVRREMSTRYGRAAGGYLWSVAEPAGMILLLSVAFAALMRRPDLGESFIVFFATGFLSFNFFRVTAQKLSGAVRANSKLVAYPGVTPYDAVAARLVLQTLTNCVVAALILGVAVSWTGERVRLDVGWIAAALSAATLMGFGVGTLNAVLFHLAPIWQRVYGIVSRPLFIVSGILYTPEILPTAVRDVLAWNPLVHVVAAFRMGVYPAYESELSNLGFPALVGLLTLAPGLMLLRRHGDAMAGR